jgi:hypothetical protein
MKINLFVTLFFRTWPGYMHVWFHTVPSSNPTITFTLLTESLSFSHSSWMTSFNNMSVPPNVILRIIPYGEVRQRAKSRLDLGFDVKIGSDPYKLCDYLPTYGILFAEELIGYTHW